ncbi:MAG: HNH endonuclease [Candidatus Pacearchaeota archaeon]|nr:HNH endonuclease [Candidatus Pacearchaeota archaeon]
MEYKLKNQIFKRDNFTCQKCNFQGQPSNLEIHYIKPKSFGGKNNPENLITLCSICHNYAPDLENNFLKYLDEKIDGNLLNTFRDSNYSISKRTQTGMQLAVQKGNHISKPPKGYKLVNKQLIPAENSSEVEQIFQEFLNTEISLTQLAKKFQMTTAGIKKLLQNKTYIGIIKFGLQETDGQHQPLLSKQLFKQVQDKLKNKGWIKF